MNKILLAALFILPTISNAVEWIDLGKSKDNSFQNFLDYDSVKRQDIQVMKSGGFTSKKSQPEYISAVFQATYINNNPLRKKGIYYSKQQWFISCEKQTFYPNAWIDYGFKDEVIDSWQSKKSLLLESDFNYAFPDTVGGDAIEQACASIALKELGSAESYEDYLQKYIYDD